MPSVLRHDGPFWRGLAVFGATYAPAAVLRHAPPLWAFAFALSLPEARARVRQNLRRVHGKRQPRQELADVFRTFSHFASCLTEGLAIGSGRSTQLDCLVEGAEHMHSARARDQGIILVTAHTGGWEAAGPLLGQLFELDVMVAMQSEPDERARRIHDEARRRSGVKVVHVGRDPLSALPLLAHLKQKGVVGLQIDRAPRSMRSVPVQFLGAPSAVPSGPFVLARATGAPIVPVFVRRIGYFRYAIKLCPVIELGRTASAETLAAAARQAASEMESFLRAHPTDWFDFGNL